MVWMEMEWHGISNSSVWVNSDELLHCGREGLPTREGSRLMKSGFKQLIIKSNRDLFRNKSTKVNWSVTFCIEVRNKWIALWTCVFWLSIYLSIDQCSCSRDLIGYVCRDTPSSSYHPNKRSSMGWVWYLYNECHSLNLEIRRRKALLGGLLSVYISGTYMSIGYLYFVLYKSNTPRYRLMIPLLLSSWSGPALCWVNGDTEYWITPTEPFALLHSRWIYEIMRADSDSA